MGTSGKRSGNSPTFSPSPNFDYLGHYDPRLVQAATLAEPVLGIDPVGSLRHLRLFAELMVQNVAARWGVYGDGYTTAELTRAVSRKGLPADVNQRFRALREAGNQASHEGLGDQQLAFQHIKIAFQLAVWFQQTFGNNRKFNPGPYSPQQAEGDTSRLKEELEALRKEADAHREQTEAARAALKAAFDAEAARALGAEQAAKKAQEEAEIWATHAAEAEAAANDNQKALHDMEAELASLKDKFETMLLEQQHAAEQAPPEQEKKRVAIATETAAQIPPDEKTTRILIDQQLRDAGWTVDSEELRYNKGVRPQKNKVLAIAEWPTKKGPADYVLFLGLQAVGVVEAKKKTKDVLA